MFFEVTTRTRRTTARRTIRELVLSHSAFRGPVGRKPEFVSEAASFFAITLVLSHASDVPVTVVVHPFASAVDGADMDLGDYTVTFAPGETTATYRAQIYNDAFDETDENVFFEIVSSTNAAIDLSSYDAYSNPHFVSIIDHGTLARLAGDLNPPFESGECTEMLYSAYGMPRGTKKSSGG